MILLMILIHCHEDSLRHYEFQQILIFEDYFPSEHYYKISDCLNKIRIEGTFPEVQEVFDLKRSLETVKSILNFFKNKDAGKYPVLTINVQFS